MTLSFAKRFFTAFILLSFLSQTKVLAENMTTIILLNGDPILAEITQEGLVTAGARGEADQDFRLRGEGEGAAEGKWDVEFPGDARRGAEVAGRVDRFGLVAEALRVFGGLARASAGDGRF